jgi:hypothetical protein
VASQATRPGAPRGQRSIARPREPRARLGRQTLDTLGQQLPRRRSNSAPPPVSSPCGSSVEDFMAQNLPAWNARPAAPENSGF